MILPIKFSFISNFGSEEGVLNNVQNGGRGSHPRFLIEMISACFCYLQVTLIFLSFESTGLSVQKMFKLDYQDSSRGGHIRIRSE